MPGLLYVVNGYGVRVRASKSAAKIQITICAFICDLFSIVRQTQCLHFDVLIRENL